MDNEFLLLDGADCIIKEVKEDFVKEYGKRAFTIEID